jgi:hypothetical protein
MFTDLLQGWGTVAGAVFSALAFLAFGLAFLWEVNKRREDDRASAIDRRQAQANGIAWYLERWDHDREPRHSLRQPEDAADSDAGGDDFERAILVVSNASTNCVTEAVATVPGMEGDLSRRGIGVVPPGLTRYLIPVRAMMDGGSKMSGRVGDIPNNKLVRTLQFRDQGDVTWIRTQNGALEELPYRKPGTDFPDYTYEG